MASRKELMKNLNCLLNTDFNWSRLSLLDLERLVLAIRRKPIVTNRNREEILLLLKKEGELTITEIADKVGLAYKNVHAHIKKLLSVGLITTEKQEKTIGRKVIVKLK